MLVRALQGQCPFTVDQTFEPDPLILPKARPPFLAKVAPGAMVHQAAWRYFAWLLTASDGRTRSLPDVIKEATGAVNARELHGEPFYCAEMQAVPTISMR